jgi:hypothetical protein
MQQEAGGFGASTSAGEGAVDVPLPPGAPVVHVRGFSYKGTVEAVSHPPAR